MLLLKFILNPLINLLLFWPTNIIWFVLTGIGLIGFMIVGIVLSMFELFSFGLINKLLFGIKEGDSIFSNTSPEFYYRILIVSAVIWMFVIFVVIFRFILYDPRKATALFKLAFKNALLAILYLVFFQIIIQVLLFFVQQITNLILQENSTDVLTNLLNSLVYGAFGDENGIPISGGSQTANFVDIFKKSGGAFLIIHTSSAAIPIPNFLITGSYGVWRSTLQGATSDPFVPAVFMSALIFMFMGFLLAIPLLYAVIDLITKVFILFALYIAFPVIAALSIGDDGLRLKTYREHFLGNLMSVVVYLVGLKVLILFASIGNSYLSARTNIADAFFTIPVLLLRIFVRFIFIYATFVAFKKIVPLVNDFLRISISGGKEYENSKAKYNDAKRLGQGSINNYKKIKAFRAQRIAKKLAKGK